MGFLVVERHVFYAEGKEFADPRSAGQTHLFLRHRRVPWENSNYKTVMYLPASQLSVPPSSGGRVAGIDRMREYLLGSEQYKHPKLIVADIHSPQEIMTKSQLGKLLVQSYAQRYSAFARQHTIRKPNDKGNEAWFIFDPSRPGRQGLKRDTYLRLAKEVLPKEAISRKMYTKNEGRRRRYNTDNIVVLGMGYRLAYYHGPTSDLADLGHDERLQQRLNKFLSQQAGSSTETGKEPWFVLGKIKIPVPSVRVHPTPLGRERRILTYRHGRGLQIPSKEEQSATRPMFLVLARTEQEAKEEARKRFKKMLGVDRRKALLQYEKWLDSGESVVPRRIWDMHRTNR